MSAKDPGQSSGAASPSSCVVILKSAAQGLRSAESFLQNRGFIVYSTHFLSTALGLVVQHNPTYVLIASDHRNKKTKMLPKLLHEAFGISVIAFTENIANSSMAQLQGIEMQYKLYPPISGPAIERMLSKVQRDRETAEATQPTEAGKDSESARSAIAAMLMEKDPEAEEFKKESLFVQGAEAALDESIHQFPRNLASPDPIKHIEAEEKFSHLACLTIDSARFSGYLVAAMKNPRKLDQAFMKLIRERLINFLRSNGEIMDEDNDPMQIKTELVEFENWALEQAEFLKKAVRGDEEVAIAFFPTQSTKVRLEASVRENMVKLKIDEIRDDSVVDFDVYIHLPENDRFLLYTPEGQKIYSTQKQRLKSKGMTHLHMRKETASDVKRYKARLFLTDKIQLFKQKKASGA